MAAARAQLNLLLQTGKDEQACRDLAQSGKDAAIASVNSAQKTLNALSTGEDCASLGQDVVNGAKDELKSKNNEFAAKHAALTALKAQVVPLPQITVEQLASMSGQCVVDKEVETVRASLQKYEDAVGAVSIAKAELIDLEKQFERMQADARQQVRQCYCQAKTELEKVWSIAEAGLHEQQKEFAKAQRLECAIDATEQCPVENLVLTKPVLVPAAEEVVCDVVNDDQDVDQPANDVDQPANVVDPTGKDDVSPANDVDQPANDVDPTGKDDVSP